MSTIKSTIEELNQLKAEILRHNLITKKLRSRVKTLEDILTKYLNEKNETGLKYQGQAIILENKEKNLPKKKKEKVNDVILFFKELGIQDADKAYTKLEQLQKGQTIEISKLKFQKLNKSK